MRWLKLWTHRPYAPTIMFYALRATVKGFVKRFPSKIGLGASIWKDAMEEYAYPEKEFLVTSDSLVKWAMAKRKEVGRFFKIAYDKSVGMRKFSEECKGKELARIESGELLAFLEVSMERYEELYSYATIASLIGYRKESPIDAKAEGILRKKLERHPEKFADYYVYLTRPPKILKTQLLELEILRLAGKTKKEGAISKEAIIGKYSPQLEKIAAEYEWLSFDLCSKAGWDVGHYADLVVERQAADIGKEISFISNYEKTAEREFVRTCRELGFGREERSLFEFIRLLGYYKWAREHEFTEAFYNLAPIQKELGKRCGLNAVESAYIIPFEFHVALKEPEKYKKIARERMKLGILLMSRDGYEFLAGPEAAEYIGKMEFHKEKVEADASELRGMPACAGMARGTVKIINTAKDMHKMREGDILVSAATTPDLVPAMKKAAAIITNEGGITCHAAIVSRELKIPCIVGVKNANRILKDGDEVGADANRGIIKRLKG